MEDQAQTPDQMMQNLVELYALKKEYEGRVKSIKAQMGELEPKVLDHFMNNGIQKHTIDGGTVYLHTQMWAGVYRGEEGNDPDSVAWPRAIKALDDAGLNEFIQTRFNSQSLSSFVRELAKDDEEVPSEFNGAITVTDKISIRVRKG